MINPRNYRVTQTLGDGTAVTIRAIHPDDRGKVVAAFMNLDRESIYSAGRQQAEEPLQVVLEPGWTLRTHQVDRVDAGAFAGKQPRR